MDKTGRRPRKEYNGKLLLRMPKSLHRLLVLEARREGVSLNQLVLTKVALRLGKVSAPETSEGV